MHAELRPYTTVFQGSTSIVCISQYHIDETSGSTSSMTQYDRVSSTSPLTTGVPNFVRFSDADRLPEFAPLVHSPAPDTPSTVPIALVIRYFTMAGSRPLVRALGFKSMVGSSNVRGPPNTFLVMSVDEVVTVTRRARPRQFIRRVMVLRDNFRRVSQEAKDEGEISLVDRRHLRRFPTGLGLRPRLIGSTTLSRVVTRVLFKDLTRQLRYKGMVLVFFRAAPFHCTRSPPSTVGGQLVRVGSVGFGR